MTVLRLWRALLAVVLVAGSVVVGSVVVALPGAGAQDGGVTARLAAQTLLLGPDQAASVVLDVAGTLPEDTEVAVVVHNRLTADREAFRQAAGGDIPTAPFRVLVTPLAAIPRDAAGRLTITVPTTSKRGSATGTEIPLRTAGVYPVEILIRSGDRNEELARVVTFLVRVPDQPTPDPLRVALVFPVVGPPALRPDGTTAIDPDLRARLQLLTNVLAAVPALAVTIQVQPELLAALGRTGLATDEALRAQLVAALNGRQTLPSTYVRMDPAAALAAGLDSELVSQLRRGEDVLVGQLGATAGDRSLWPSTTALDDRAATFLRDLGFRQLLLPGDALEPAGGASAPLRPTSLPASGTDRPLAVASADTGLSGGFGPHAEPVRDAYVWLSELALLALEPADKVGGPQGVVVLPTSWSPDGVFLSTILAGLQGNPLAKVVTASQLFAEVLPAETSGGKPEERRLAPGSPADLHGYADELGRTRADLASYGSMMPPSSPMPTQADELLQVSASADLAPDERDAYLAAVERDIDALRRSVDPVAARTITLAGRTTELPLTITSRADESLQVKVRLSSSKLRFPEGNELLVTVTGGAAQVRVPVEARTSGTFPVNVELLTPAGDQPVAPSTQLTIRSTGLSGLGLALSVGALLVLALWWTRHVLHARRRRKAVRAADRHPSTSPPPATTVHA